MNAGYLAPFKQWKFDLNYLFFNKMKNILNKYHILIFKILSNLCFFYKTISNLHRLELNPPSYGQTTAGI